MTRLILALVLFAVLALAVMAGLALARAVRASPSPSREVAMPGAVRTVSYIVLLLLLLGVTSGLMGPA